MTTKKKSEAKTHGCGIPGCEKKWTRGGIAGDGTPETERCPMHYHRERRGSTNADQAGKLYAGDKVRGHFTLPAEVQQRLELYAAEVNRSQSDVVAEAVDKLISAREGARSRTGS